MLRSALFRVVICAVGLIPIWGESAEPVSYRVYPERVELDGPEATEQLLVFAKTDSAPTIDLTHQVSYTTLDTHIVAVSSSGRITPRGDGTTRVVVEMDGQCRLVSVIGC